MTAARIQPFCKKRNINIDCFGGSRKKPRNSTEKNIACDIHKSHFCSVWKSQNVNFLKKTMEELKLNFKVVDIYISDKHDEKFIKYEYNPEKVKKFQLTNKNIYD